MGAIMQASIQLVLAVVAILAFQLTVTAQIPLDRQVGEVFVAIGNGQYQVWHPTPPTAALVETITQNFDHVNLTGATAGCAFDPTYHPFTTNVTNNVLLRHGIEDPQNGIAEMNIAGESGAQPTSVAFDSAGNSYVGNAGGNGLIQEYSPTGSFVQTLPAGTNNLSAGSPWIDLSADGSTMYFTNGSSIINQFLLSSSSITSFATIVGANLYALRVLPAATTNGGVLLVAAVSNGSSNIQLLNASGSTVQAYSVAGENNFQVLTLDSNGTSFWAGNPTTYNFYRINLATGNIEVSVNTGVSSGPTGICAYGAFSAPLYQPIRVSTSFTSPSSAGCAIDTQNNTLADCTFFTLIPDPVLGPNHFGITLNGIDFGNAPNGLQVTYSYSQIAAGTGTSDTGLACDTTSPDGTKCEVHSIDVYPTNGSNDTSIYQSFDTDIFTTQSTMNPRVLKNELHELTDFIIRGSTRGGGSDTTKSIFTINQQPIQVTGSQSCGYISPLLNSQYKRGRTIPFKFQAVSPPNTCASGPYLSTLNPRLVLVQLTNLTTQNAAPRRVDFSLSNGTRCTEASPCYFRYTGSGNWVLNVDTSSLLGGGTQYLGTTIDDSNQIPVFSNTQFGPADIFSVK